MSNRDSGILDDRQWDRAWEERKIEEGKILKWFGLGSERKKSKRNIKAWTRYLLPLLFHTTMVHVS